MRIPKYWAHESKSVRDPRGKWMKLAIWQWSDQSVADAREQASMRIGQLVAKLQNGERLNRYSYGDRPLREEALQAIKTDRGHEAGVITRNGYGAAVLNTSNAMFIDIDFPNQGGPSYPKLIPNVPDPNGPIPEQRALASVEEWAARNVGLGIRIYRTARGLRGLITNELLDPTKDSTLDMLRELECDPLYIRLCREQGCFRARLTPKHWRCRMGAPPCEYPMPAPPSGYPWENADAERRYRRWEQEYSAASARYATCRLIKQIGNPEVHPDIAPVLVIHDQMTGIQSNLPLA